MNEKDSIDYLLESLKDQERSVLENYYGIGRESIRLACYKAIGKKFDLSGNRIAQIHKKALRRLRLKGLQHHSRAVKNPELFFDIFGETKECLHMKIYFESYFKEFENLNLGMWKRICTLNETIRGFETKLNNGFTNLTNVLKGSEFNRFIQDLNLVATSVGVQMNQVRAVSAGVTSASNAQVTLYNDLQKKIIIPDDTAKFDMIFAKFIQIENMFNDVHWTLNQVLENSKADCKVQCKVDCNYKKKRRITEK